MKHEFATLLVDAPAVLDEAPDVRKQRLAAREKRDQLLQLSAGADLRAFSLYTPELLPTLSQRALQTISYIHPRSHVLLAGDCAPPILAMLQEALFARQCDMHVLVDALSPVPGLEEALNRMQEQNLVQIGHVGALAPLLFCEHAKIYAYNMVAGTGSLIVIIDAGTPRAKVLLVRRKYEPFKGCLAIPGGFLRTYLENLKRCSKREEGEECRVDVDLSQATLIGESSNPDSDPRGHFISAFYLVCVPARERKRVVASVAAGDDAEWAGFVSVERALSMPLAFNHKQYLQIALQHPRANSFMGVVRASISDILASAINNLRARFH